MYYLVGIIIVLIIIIVLEIVSLKKERKVNLSLSQQLSKLGVNLGDQQIFYNGMITKAKDSDSLSKLKRMKEPHCNVLRHINSIIRKNYYKTIPPHKQAKLVG